jgi:hypothetical protein
MCGESWKQTKSRIEHQYGDNGSDYITESNKEVSVLFLYNGCSIFIDIHRHSGIMVVLFDWKFIL